MTSLDVLKTMSGTIFIIGTLATLNGTILTRPPKMFGPLKTMLMMLFKDLTLFMITDDLDLEI